jgi:hypothetical protein
MPGQTGRSRRPLQPLLHDLASSVCAPALLLGSRDGQIRPGGVSGWYVDDVRMLDRILLSVDGSDLDTVRVDASDTRQQAFGYVARGLGDPIQDPTVFLDRSREVGPTELRETVVVSSAATEPVDVAVHLDLGSDLAAMGVVRHGDSTTPVRPEGGDGELRWLGEGVSCAVLPVPAPDAVDVAPDGSSRLTWRARVGRGARLEIRCRVVARVDPLFAPGGPPPWSVDAGVRGADRRLDRLVRQSLGDLAGLLLRDRDEDGSPTDQFLAAGSPWFLTLFGRDSLWAARMLAPFAPDLMLSTLRILARRQGRAPDPVTEEQPGKILHEVRNAPLEMGELSLPPVYFGTVDATPLFVATVADAWQWGAGDRAVAGLLPAVRGCLSWMTEQSRETGWLRYIDRTGKGLSNQGWKDSHDSVQFADGRLADPPIALCEVQGYAYEAAQRGAALLAAFGEPEVDGLGAWAADLRTRFARDFWVDDAEGGYPAIALDGGGNPVDSVASNMGHLLGTGILDADQAAMVRRRLERADMSSGFGLRTLTSGSPRFSRLSYHGGTVWPHDTAVAVLGLAREGHVDAAAGFAAALVDAAEGFGFRLPELFGGDSADEVSAPSDYPAACRPQAWAAAAPLACLVAATGLQVDVPRRTVSHPRRVPARLGEFRLEGLRAGEERFTVQVGPDGRVSVSGLDGFTVDVRG